MKKKTRNRYVSYPNQREQCRLNKYTYIEKCDNCKSPVLMCNYPFHNPTHRKGVCRASVCTDLRTIPADIVEADIKDEAPTCDEPDQTTTADSGPGSTEAAKYNLEEDEVEAVNRVNRPKPEDIAKSA